MEKLLPVYRVLSFILLVVAGFLALADLLSLLLSLANPAVLLSVFILSGVIIYTFTSFYFYREGIRRGRLVKKSLKDWIKVNSFVAIFFSAIILIDTAAVLTHPELIDNIYKQALSMQPDNAGSALSGQSFRQMIKGMFSIFAVYAIVLVGHIVITFRLLKRYGYLFNGTGDDKTRSKDDLL